MEIAHKAREKGFTVLQYDIRLGQHLSFCNKANINNMNKSLLT